MGRQLRGASAVVAGRLVFVGGNGHGAPDSGSSGLRCLVTAAEAAAAEVAACAWPSGVNATLISFSGCAMS